jgi:hypothetical protein
MDIEDSAIECLESLLGGSWLLEGNKMCVGGETVHNNHAGCVSIALVKGTGEVNRQRLVGCIGVEEGKGMSMGKGSGFLVDLTLLLCAAV